MNILIAVAVVAALAGIGFAFYLGTKHRGGSVIDSAVADVLKAHASAAVVKAVAPVAPAAPVAPVAAPVAAPAAK